MRQWTLTFLLATGCALAACGDSKKTPDRPASQSASRPAQGGPASNATAAQVAAEARGKVRCPAKVATPARPAGAPVDDVVGVRPGLTYEEAANIVLCTNDLMVVNETGRSFQIQTYGQKLRQGFQAAFAKERVQRTPEQIMRDLSDSAMARGSNRVVRDVRPGESRWYVATMGLPGKERVISAAREEWFEEGRYPTLASVEEALVAKYGKPSTGLQQDQRRWQLQWTYDLRQRPVTEASPLHQQCRGQANPDGATSFSPDCGIVVQAVLVARQDNPQLAESLQVGVLDHAGGYEAITSTERALEELEARRRAHEVESAAKNASAPTL